MAFSLSDTSFSFSGAAGAESWAGKQFTTSRRSTSIEKINRAGMPEEVLQNLRAKRPPVDDTGEADLRWGKASTFTLTEPKDNQPTNPSFHVVNSSTGDDEVPPEAQLFDFQEYSRQEEEIRVENPDDAEQYVMVKRIQWIIFLGPDKNFWRYTLKYKTT